MRPTAELRWFYEGELPDEVVAWFEGLDAPALSGTPRTDRYLRPTDAATNLKQREGRLEVKRRDAEGMAVTLGDGRAGCLERWRKWSFVSADLDAPDVAHLASAFWIPVWKARQKCLYAVVDGGYVEPRATEDGTARGCDLELTRVERDGALWWSLCFEAFGAETLLQDTLLRVAHHVFDQGTAPPLTASASYGYAAWLQEWPGIR